MALAISTAAEHHPRQAADQGEREHFLELETIIKARRGLIRNQALQEAAVIEDFRAQSDVLLL